ncbi:AAA family ATPase [Nonomuraea typhae]|uniref:AAA family ATPase n=1 Tax=Nonomuraea typhae TaxID=2603600 RepID=UPI001CA5C12A|nr:AAA family ATPase [Nonomuraea typhae]
MTQTTTSRTGQTQAMTTTAASLRAITEELSAQFYERASVVRALMGALLAGQHSLLLGPPGTAKSELARELTSRITDARYWEVLLSKFTDPKRLFGPIDVAALTRGEYTQVFDGRATRADIAFIDEIFKCSAGALNETLAFLNERLYHPENGGKPIICPLISAITASNELGSGEETTALYDRLLVRVEVGYLADPSHFAQLIRSAVVAGPVPAATTVPLADLRQAVESEVPAIAVPDGIVDAICQLRAALRAQELISSDRRWKASVRLLQASAYLAGRPEIEESDLAVLANVLWDSPAERPTVEREVFQLINPDAKEALDLKEAIDELEAQLDSKAGQSRESLSEWGIKEANKKLSRAGKRLVEMRQEAESTGRSTILLDEVIARRRAVHARIMVEALGVDASMVASSI